jgi:hypothetical protein
MKWVRRREDATLLWDILSGAKFCGTPQLVRHFAENVLNESSAPRAVSLNLRYGGFCSVVNSNTAFQAMNAHVGTLADSLRCFLRMRSRLATLPWPQMRQVRGEKRWLWSIWQMITFNSEQQYEVQGAFDARICVHARQKSIQQSCRVRWAVSPQMQNHSIGAC